MSKSNRLESIFKNIQEGIISGEICEKDILLVARKLEAYYKSATADPDKTYFEKEDGDFCYKGVLEGMSYNEVLEELRRYLDKSEEWLRSTRNNAYKYSKETVNTFEQHPKQVEMTKHKTIDKIALAKSRSLVELVKRLESQVSIHNTLMEHKEDITDLKASSVEKEIRIKRLEEEAGLGNLTDQELCKALYENGFKQKELSKRFGVDVRTIRRWCK